MVGKRKPSKKMTSRPNDLKKNREQFTPEPSHKTEQELQVDPQKKPWMKEGLSERVPKPMSVRLSEVDQAKLDYILANTKHKSKHKFCIDVIKRAINRALKEID